MGKKLTYALYAIGFLDLLGVSLIIPLLPHHARSLKATPAVIGALGSLYGGLQLLSGPIVGQMSDVYGRHPVLLVTLLGAAVSYFVAGVSTTLVMLTVARVLAGLFKHSLGLARTWLADTTTPEERPKCLGHYGAMSSMAFIVGPAIGGHLASGSENGFFIASVGTVLTFMTAFVLTLFMRRWEEGVRGKRLSSKSEDATDSDIDLPDENQLNPLAMFRTLWHISWHQVPDLMLLRFMFGFAMLLFRSNFTLFLELRFESTPVINGYVLSANGIMGALASSGSGLITGFYGGCTRPLLQHMSFLFAAAITAMTFSPDLIVFVACMAPMAVASAVLRVSMTHLSVERGKVDQRGAVLGVGASVMSLARMLAPGFAGVLTQYGGLYLPSLVSIFVSVIAGTIFVSRTQLPVHSTIHEKKIS